MHKWFTQKLNEMIGLAHYCQFPILKAHFILTQKAVDEMYGKSNPEDDCLKQILPLLISHSESRGDDDVRAHLEEALAAAEQKSGNVVSINFSASALPQTQFGNKR
ncbi:hypothetical protein [Cognatishimia maritima]|uniref:Uncharacterized protein n=1 Tax=Cognatishimia maritima TaxID=870908 RepID=A0A1M5KTE5_9RHOB|nr:hypothetical protein [Cognatishimia maritima]SHG56006.1 hypothetical protein SAMN04488044_1068 [Cognatishimia maritima]